MQVIWCKTWKSNLYAYCNQESFLNGDVSMFHCCNMKKIESHIETQSSDAQRINLTFVPHRFVANFVSYICAKYYLNWFSFHIVIMSVIGVNFFWNTVYNSVCPCVIFVETTEHIIKRLYLVYFSRCEILTCNTERPVKYRWNAGLSPKFVICPQNLTNTV